MTIDFAGVVVLLALVANVLLTLFLIRILRKYTEANNSLFVRQNISALNARKNQIAIELVTARVKESNEIIDEIYEAVFDSANNDYLNFFNGICANYLDGNINKKRFKIDYKPSIESIYNDKHLRKMILEEQEGYASLIAVIKEFGINI